jgi:hypothetical protein
MPLTTYLTSRKLTAGYFTDGAIAGKFSYTPILGSLKYIHFDDADDAWFLEPGYKIVLYQDQNYLGASFTMGDYTETEPMFKTSVELIGANNTISSYKLYYLSDTNEIKYAYMS